mgnify:FL=1|jgi:hypothetical protein
MEKKKQRKLNNLRYRLRKDGYQINDEVKIVILPENGKRSIRRESGIKSFGYDLQNNLFEIGDKTITIEI